MSTYSRSHLTDQALLRNLVATVARDRTNTAELLADIAEVDARRLYVAAAHPSMYSYCVHVLHLSEDAACKRICAARAARRFPAILGALADARLHLSAIVQLAPYLTPENADELLGAAAHKSKSEIEQLLVQQFPRSDLPTRLEAISTPSPTPSTMQLTSGVVGQSAPGRIEEPFPRPKLTPLAPQRFGLQVTIAQSTQDKLQQIKALLSHQVPSGDIAEVLDRAFDIALRQLQKRKFAATDEPRQSQKRPTPGSRHIPAHVRRAVSERDGGRCTFVSNTGQRCPARSFLEFDHVEEVARGGTATVSGIRMRCRAHNQYTAECAFGTEFMNNKRAAAAEARAKAAESRAKKQAEERDVIPWLRTLGFRADEARRAAEFCESIPEASLEERVRAAVSYLAPAHHRPKKA